MVGDKAYLQNFIGYSNFWLIDEFGNLIEKFEHMLLDVVINLTSNYKSLLRGEITEGNLFVMEAEWKRHFSFIKIGDNYQFSFSNFRNIVLTSAELHSFLNDLIVYSFQAIEFLYKGIINNINYMKWKEEVYGNLDKSL